MSNRIRKCRLANSTYKDIDLLNYKEIIIDTINKTVPGKNPQVYSDYFSTDALTHSESVALDKASSKMYQKTKGMRAVHHEVINTVKYSRNTNTVNTLRFFYQNVL